MAGAFRRLLDETWIVILASGIALAYALLAVAEGLARFVDAALQRQTDESSFAAPTLGPLGVRWGRHEFDFGFLVEPLIEAGVVVAIVVLVVAAVQRYEDALPEDPPPE